jgi:hypothetical protein
LIRRQGSRSEELQDIDEENTKKEQQGDGTEQEMADIVVAILVPVGQRMIGDDSGYQEKYPIQQWGRPLCEIELGML